ncbi:tol-pal system YbgF family protein [Fibrobacter sp. UWH4]|uniref:tetratricopeptide repeat protein n=1 Tax=Fibrobacter sp. UWH4 TaxID=1896210 RepID=UPI00091343D3|nr:tetratricopeptide repeat protein [Fibrobacter sp. UWH4]SHK95006.1 TolA-binding protein [Fibrobacter sp. UWH4]
MTNLKLLTAGFAAMVLIGCSQMTVLRTKEMKAVGAEVQTSLDSAVQSLSAQNDSLRAELDSTKALLDASALAQKRMQAEITMLSRRVSDESERNDSRQEEIIYRLDMLLGKSDKILAKKVVVSGAPAPVSMDSLEHEAEKLVEAEAMFNTARSDYHRGEFKLAYNGLKQVYEQMKEGELAENSLYWMALCLIDVNQVDKAKKVFARMSEAFPDGQKTCPALFKLSSLYGEECDIDMQKQYLQKILSTKSCEKSPEFEQAAEMLQEILEKEDKKSAGEPVERCVPVVREPVKPTSRKSTTDGASEPTASATTESTEAAL